VARSPITVSVDISLTPEARRLLSWQGNCLFCGHRYNALDRSCPACGAQLPSADPIAIDPNPYFIPPNAGGIQPSEIHQLPKDDFERRARSWLGVPPRPAPMLGDPATR